MAPVLRREPQQQARLTQAAAFVARLQVGCTFISKKKKGKTKYLVVLPCFAFSSIPFRIAVGKITVQTKIFFSPPSDLNRRFTGRRCFGKGKLGKWL